MKNKLLIMAVAALAVAACAKQQDVPVEETQPMAVGFDAYLNRAVTKADPASYTTTATLAASGFGIFAYYTDNDDYSGSNIPNFMYNQQVSSAGWTYSPVKYWPNEYGDNAKAEESDRISFFAYGPYVAATASTGKVANAETGIIGFTRNNYAGDPLVKYVVDLDPNTSIDLVWGVQPNPNSFVSYDNKFVAKDGFPWLNVRRPQYSNAATEKVKFQFEHALAALNVTVDHFLDQSSYATPHPVNSQNTRIWIRSITFTGFATEGALNLNNNASSTALWESINGDDLVNGEEITIYDGRKDGREGSTSASNEKYTGLNPNLVQNAPYATASANGTDIGGQSFNNGDWLAVNGSTYYSGVLNAPQNLFDPTYVTETDPGDKLNAPIYVIPTGDAVKVTIAYDVETLDNKLATFLSDGTTKGSSISNVITKDVGISKMENGKKYLIKLHLGMNSVKVDAAVTAWDATTAQDVDLPAN